MVDKYIYILQNSYFIIIYNYTKKTHIILTRASRYSILLSSVVNFSFKIANLDRHDISIKTKKNVCA